MPRTLLVTCALFISACGGDGQASPARAPVAAATATVTAIPSKPDRFDAPAAFRLIRRQVSYGQRPAGSPQLRRLAKVLRAKLPDGRFEAIPNEPLLRNVVAVLPGTKPALVVGAHYDTLVKPKGFVGANNGAAGTAIVVQIARELAARKRPRGAPEVRFVLFDGEEPAEGLPEEQTDFYSSGLRGSRAYADAHASEVGAMVLLDYVANRDLQLPREQTSTPELWAQIRAASRRAGAARFFPDGLGPSITDDHSPFLRAGIPAVDLIDWSYDEGHTLEDGLDKLSVAAVDGVGETVLRFVEAWRP